jgi:hypothetical protein
MKGSRKYHTHRLSKEYDIGFYESPALAAPGDLSFLDQPLNLVRIESDLAVDTTLCCKASMRFYKLLLRNTCPSFKGIDVLRETGPQETFFFQQAYE